MLLSDEDKARCLLKFGILTPREALHVLGKYTTNKYTTEALQLDSSDLIYLSATLPYRDGVSYYDALLDRILIKYPEERRLQIVLVMIELFIDSPTFLSKACERIISHSSLDLFSKIGSWAGTKGLNRYLLDSMMGCTTSSIYRLGIQLSLEETSSSSQDLFYSFLFDGNLCDLVGNLKFINTLLSSFVILGDRAELYITRLVTDSKIDVGLIINSLSYVVDSRDAAGVMVFKRVIDSLGEQLKKIKKSEKTKILSHLISLQFGSIIIPLSKIFGFTLPLVGKMLASSGDQDIFESVFADCSDSEKSTLADLLLGLILGRGDLETFGMVDSILKSSGRGLNWSDHGSLIEMQIRLHFTIDMNLPTDCYSQLIYFLLSLDSLTNDGWSGLVNSLCQNWETSGLTWELDFAGELQHLGKLLPETDIFLKQVEVKQEEIWCAIEDSL